MSVDINIINRRVIQMNQDLGRGVVHQMFPKDFEYYMIALELVDGGGDTIDYLAFPVLPSAITKTENKRINIKKAYKSTLILTSTAFTPQDIVIRGNFGRSFKILLGNKEIFGGVALAVSTRAGVFELSQQPNQNLLLPSNQFNQFIKTGYGVIKLLQSIIHKSDGSDQRGPYRLYFYNFALGESYLVVAPSKALVLEQNDTNMNMIWHYTLNLTIVAPLELVKNTVVASSCRELLGIGVIQNTVNKAARDISNFVSRVVR